MTTNPDLTEACQLAADLEIAKAKCIAFLKRVDPKRFAPLAGELKDWIAERTIEKNLVSFDSHGNA